MGLDRRQIRVRRLRLDTFALVGRAEVIHWSAECVWSILAVKMLGNRCSAATCSLKLCLASRYGESKMSANTQGKVRRASSAFVVKFVMKETPASVQDVIDTNEMEPRGRVQVRSKIPDICQHTNWTIRMTQPEFALSTTPVACR